jgi:acetolactate synthase-1/2/3 large subunit
MDVQRMDVPASAIDERAELPAFTDVQVFDEIFTELARAEKPLILIGGGIHSARAVDLLRKFVDLMQVPVVNSLMAVDELPYGHPLRIGLIGSYGNRWANMALGTCDFLLVLGSRLDIRQTGADVQSFQSKRRIFHVDCDAAEINNRVLGCRAVVADLKPFLSAAIQAAAERRPPPRTGWLQSIQRLKREWPDDREAQPARGINPNHLMHAISAVSGDAGAYVVDVGNHQMWAAQSIETTAVQHFLTSGGMGSMGYSLPAAVGASLALPGQPIVQIAGDGGMQMNIQEMQTIVEHQLPIKMVILNNRSYGMVRQFQQSYFHDQFPSTLWGYSAPAFSKVAEAYGIESARVDKGAAVDRGLRQLWRRPLQPFLLEVLIDPGVNAYPKIAFGHPITEMEPFVKPLDMEGT